MPEHLELETLLFKSYFYGIYSSKHTFCLYMQDPARPSLVLSPSSAVEETLRRRRKWCSDQFWCSNMRVSLLSFPTPVFPLWSYLSPETCRDTSPTPSTRPTSLACLLFSRARSHTTTAAELGSAECVCVCVCVERAFLQSCRASFTLLSAHTDTLLSAIRAMFVTLQIFQLPLKTVYLPRPDPHSLAFFACALRLSRESDGGHGATRVKQRGRSKKKKKKKKKRKREKARLQELHLYLVRYSDVLRKVYMQGRRANGEGWRNESMYVNAQGKNRYDLTDPCYSSATGTDWLLLQSMEQRCILFTTTSYPWF